VKPKLLTPETGASVSHLISRNSGSSKRLPNFIKPMLASLHDKPFDDPNWIYEIKWDGYRAIAEINKKDIRLYSRNGISFKDDYPGIYEELHKIKKNVVIDGEIVALDKNGKPHFQLLQQYAKSGEVPVCYYVFDCLYVNGRSIENKPLIERKKILKDLLPESNIVKFCDHIEGTGKAFFALAKKEKLEGVVAKRADSIYRENSRSADWLKLKNIIMDEAVIAGYTQPRGGRKYFGALVLGLYKKGKLIYIGHTGTGFTDATLKEVYDKMQPLKTDKSPFDTKVTVNAPVTWVKPKLVCNLKYSEVTTDNRRRHPVFLGLRIDMDPEDVTERT